MVKKIPNPRLKVDKSRLRMEKAEEKVKKAQTKVTERSANRKLYEKVKPSSKLHDKPQPSDKLIMVKGGRLSPECDPHLQRKVTPKVKGQFQRGIQKMPDTMVRGQVHREITKQEEDNTGLQAVHKTEQVVETTSRYSNFKLKSIRQEQQLRPFREMEKAEQKLHKAESKLHKKTIKYQHEKSKAQKTAQKTAEKTAEKSSEVMKSNPISKLQQKMRIKQSYAKRFSKGKEAIQKTGRAVGQAVSNTIKRVQELARVFAKAVASNPQIALICLGIFLLIAIISAIFSMGSLISQGIFGVASSTSYMSEESDMLQVESNYNGLEQSLQNEVDNIESEFSGYDEYRYNLSEIGHDPHDLACLLSALYITYTPDSVASMLDVIFERQYTLSTSASTEVKYDDEGTPYQWKVLTVTLTNSAIGSFASEYLTDEQYEHYLLLKSTKGNNPNLFGDYSGSSSGDLSYTIPSHYLTDDKFAALMNEATKYLGYPYVWGGSSPSTSFDCSGFVCWVLRVSGVWNISRTTAQGIFNQTITIPASERQAGDIVFFTGTYNSTGPVSHVGIYVGDGMMIHCGNPISYASVDGPYWSSYFYAYGRIPE